MNKSNKITYPCSPTRLVQSSHLMRLSFSWFLLQCYFLYVFLASLVLHFWKVKLSVSLQEYLRCIYLCWYTFNIWSVYNKIYTLTTWQWGYETLSVIYFSNELFCLWKVVFSIRETLPFDKSRNNLWIIYPKIILDFSWYSRKTQRKKCSSLDFIMRCLGKLFL